MFTPLGLLLCPGFAVINVDSSRCKHLFHSELESTLAAPRTQNRCEINAQRFNLKAADSIGLKLIANITNLLGSE